MWRKPRIKWNQNMINKNNKNQGKNFLWKLLDNKKHNWGVWIWISWKWISYWSDIYSQSYWKVTQNRTLKWLE